MIRDLVAMRVQHKLKQGVVAERMGVSQSAVSQFERYDSNPKLSTVRRYALAVGARIEYRLTDDYQAPLMSAASNGQSYSTGTTHKDPR